MSTVDAILDSYLRKYPGMEIRDCVKLLYQRYMGPGHLIASYETALARVKAERTPGTCGARLEYIGNGLARLYLEGEELEISSEEIARLFCETAERFEKRPDLLRAALAELQDETGFVAAYINEGMPMLSHSEVYRSLYKPAYRVISIKLLEGKYKMSEENRIFEGVLFAPGAQELRDIKMKAHNLDSDYNRTYEFETEKRAEILKNLLGDFGEGSFIQGPIAFHYGVHTHIGKRFFGNFNLTVQDDAPVIIGDDCNFGPNVSIVTPIHPLIASERKAMLDPEGNPKHCCYAKPVKIGNDCWLGANVTVCPGVTIGDRCVIGAGAVVTRDIPDDSFAAGVPCRVIRQITQEDSMMNKPEILGGYKVIE